jgi:hypothetical protein
MLLAMKSSLVAALAACTLSGMATAGSCARLELEAVSSLTIKQVGQLATDMTESGAHYAAALREFDRESHSTRGALHAAALLLVGMGDIDEDPVGALVWSSEVVDLSLKHLGNDEFMITAHGAGKGCTPAQIGFRVIADGTVVAGHQLLGKVR